MSYRHTIGSQTYLFENLKEVLAKASPLRSGDEAAGIAAGSNEERVAAQMTLANLPLTAFLNEAVIAYEEDEVTRLIYDQHKAQQFSTISHHTVGSFREWLLNDDTSGGTIASIRDGFTPEMIAAVSKIMRNQDLILVAQKCEIVTKFRSTVGLKGTLATRLQPNHPTDDPKAILASIIDGLYYANGDATIGINPATDSPERVLQLLHLIDDLRSHFKIPTQSCVLAHATTTLALAEKGAPVDLMFQSIGGTQKTNESFGVSISLLKEAQDATLALKRNERSNQVMYFETGQGSSLSANAHHGVDQQTCETRAYALAKHFDPFLVNSVVGFIGPEYLYDGKQITRAGLEDHFCGKMLGIPMGQDICYTNHAEADQDDMDNLLSLLVLAGCNFIMGIPGSDDIMLHYQSTSFHDALYVRKVLGKKPAPEFLAWLEQQGMVDEKGLLLPSSSTKSRLLSYI
ncbi:MAG: ethanolamine ammonia-lyase subunit EutB [Chitinophagaceae bacterium]|nr:ethanolamine ammonia-lyase subunit EutB [Chitinophagaceae bacterium]